MKNIPTFKPTSRQRAWVELQSDKLECSYTAYIKKLIDDDIKRNKFKLDNADCAYYMQCADDNGMSFPEWYKQKDKI